MSLNPIEKQIEGAARAEARLGDSDPYKRFYKKGFNSDETPTPVMQGMIPKTDLAVEKRTTTELHNPGEFCYRNMAIATGSGFGSGTVFVKRVMMNCPFCNKPQFLYNNEKVYDGAPDPRGAIKKLFNGCSKRLLKREIWPWTEQLTGTLTVKGPVTCHFNDLHKWTVVKNKISFYYPKTLVK